MSATYECDCGCHLPDHWPFDCRVWSNDRSACCDNAPVHNRPYPGDADVTSKIRWSSWAWHPLFGSPEKAQEYLTTTYPDRLHQIRETAGGSWRVRVGRVIGGAA